MKCWVSSGSNFNCAGGATVVSPALHRLLRNRSASLSMKGIEWPSARVSGRQRVAPVARLGLRECQNIPSPRGRAKENKFCTNRGFRNSLFSVGRATTNSSSAPSRRCKRRNSHQNIVRAIALKQIPRPVRPLRKLSAKLTPVTTCRNLTANKSEINNLLSII